MRIKVLSKNREVYIETCRKEDCGKEKNLLEILQENHISISNFCHGNGTCGKCKVRVAEGYLPITEADRKNLSEQELQQGIRLACKVDIGKIYEEQKIGKVKADKLSVGKVCQPENKISVEKVCQPKNKISVEKVCQPETEELCIEILGESEEDIVVEGIEKQINENVFMNSQKRKVNKVNKGKKTVQETFQEQNHFIAIDIGTTTIAMALINEETGEVCDTYTSLNHQRKYGADVISRITAANNGKGEALKRAIEEDLQKGMEKLLQNEMEEEDSIRNKCKTTDCDAINGEITLTKIIIVGNTTMIHLLMGYSCESLGKAPFVSEHLGMLESKLKECISIISKNDISKKTEIVKEDSVIQNYENIPITIFPGISAFVGGDIVAGILACGGFETEELSLLLDLGTNGELVLGNKNKILTTSTAAGPAFEGGNITSGTASVPGSICQVKIQNQKAVVRTIKKEMPPVGICGTGVISAMAQLVKNKLVKEDGELKKPYDEKGFPLWIFENGEKIAIYQKDIREFQMAKAAIRTGIDILLEEYGCSPEEVKRVYIAGGFGKALNIEEILTVGMVPEVFKDKISILGNSALQGAVCFGKNPEAKKKIEQICQRAENITLSQNAKFQNKYLEYMKLQYT